MRTTLIALVVFGWGCASSHGLERSTIADASLDASTQDADRGDAPNGPTRFALTLYASSVATTYQYTDLVSRFDARTQEPFFELNERDIVEYRSQRSSSSLAAPPGAIELVLTDDAAARLHAIPETQFSDNRVFQVTLDGARVYLGVIYTPIGAAAIATPILHGDGIQSVPRNNVIVIGNGLVSGSPVMVDAPVLRAFFNEIGVASP